MNYQCGKTIEEILEDNKNWDKLRSLGNELIEQSLKEVLDWHKRNKVSTKDKILAEKFLLHLNLTINNIFDKGIRP